MKSRVWWLLLLLGLVLLGVVLLRSRSAPPTTLSDNSPQVLWAFEAVKRGGIFSAPLVTPDRIFVSAVHDNVFWNAGAVYGLTRDGKLLWTFDDGGKMVHPFSSPCLADGRVYVGEGMHAHFTCKFYCLDAATGRKVWDFTAAGHIESSPCVAAGRVFFGAGDDGLYCLDAETGRKLWQWAGPGHIDASPVVVGKRVYVGSGVSRALRSTEALCFDVETGKPLWREPMPLPVWATATVAEDDVFFGLGNGRLDTPALAPEMPAGALVCLNATTGDRRWRFPVGDSVFGKAVVTTDAVFFGARDGHCYRLDRHSGELRWKQRLAGPVIAGLALCAGKLYALPNGGPVCCLDAASGEVLWTFDLAKHAGATPRLFSVPAVLPDGERQLVIFGAELSNQARSAAVVYCLAAP